MRRPLVVVGAIALVVGVAAALAGYPNVMANLASIALLSLGMEVAAALTRAATDESDTGGTRRR